MLQGLNHPLALRTPEINVSFTSALVHGFSTGLGIVVLEAEYAINGLVDPIEEVYRHLVLEVLGSLTHSAKTMKGRLLFPEEEDAVSLADIFREMCAGLVDESKMPFECVRIPSYCLMISGQCLGGREELRLFSHKLARRHTPGYQTIIEEDHRVSTYSNIEFTSAYEGSSLWVEVSDRSPEFFRQFRTSSWRKVYIPIHTLILHEYFYLRFLQDSMSRRAEDLQKRGDKWFSSKSEIFRKEDEQLLSQMRNFLLRFRTHNISTLQHHNDVYQKTRTVLGLPQTLAVIESDFQAIQAERAIQVQRDTVLLNRTARVVGFIVAILITGAGLVSGINDAFELLKKFEAPVQMTEEKK